MSNVDDLLKAIHFATPILRGLVNGKSLTLSVHSPDEIKNLVTLLKELGYLTYVGFTSADGDGYHDYMTHYVATQEARDFLRPYLFPKTKTPLKGEAYMGAHTVEFEFEIGGE